MTFTMFCVLLLMSYGGVGVLQESARRRCRPVRLRPGSEDSSRPWPSVDILIPSYNEEPDELDACLSAVAVAQYAGPLRVYVVDDGSARSDERDVVYGRIAGRPGWSVVRLTDNRGKRRAQHAGFVLGRSSLVLCVDSDTRIGPGAVTALVRHFEDAEVGAVSGVLHVRTGGVLTRLCALEYLMADGYRARQSVDEAVLCCSGAFSMYRRSALEAVWPAYQEHRFLGVPCRHGEDLYLTSLLLGVGLRTRFAAEAEAWTTAPDRLGRYVRQQLRWSRSFWRELPRLVGQLRSRPARLSLDVAMGAVPPLLYVIPLLLWTAESPTHAAVAAAVFVMAESALTFFRTGGHALWVRYAALRVLVQIPVQVWALFTVYDQAWMTRDPVRPSAQ
ncbi:glycosyltransferase family 2 protein [Streptomyces sp. Root1310]|uniref:glycosyltransferase family 2 protein n=1 Tax=Streptomyces sp. Root1310 TaxID=1736452 RepID=UPI00070DAC78|nr:glycosyltransferase family 2 protein [Streptomyces sp. Root1310]KQX82205.1 hypothetical protein ASD48_02570 [Streptomyces sp. Root1310]